MLEMEIFTDGSAISNKKDACAGWAAYYVELDKLRSGSMHGTNNQAELFAIKTSLWYCDEKLYLTDTAIVIKSDSEYAINASTGKNKAKANVEEINEIKKLIKQLTFRNNTVTFIHVDAHTGGSDRDSVYNDIVDKEARRQAMSIDK